MCESDSTMKWEHDDATWLAPGGSTHSLGGPWSLCLGILPVFNIHCTQYQILQRCLQPIHLGYVGHENLMQSLREYKPCMILPCWLYHQYVGPALSNTKTTGFLSRCLLEVARNLHLNLHPKNTQYEDSRLQQTCAWCPRVCRLWATTDGDIGFRSPLIVASKIWILLAF